MTETLIPSGTTKKGDVENTRGSPPLDSHGLCVYTSLLGHLKTKIVPLPLIDIIRRQRSDLSEVVSGSLPEDPGEGDERGEGPTYRLLETEVEGDVPSPEEGWVRTL